MFLSKHFWLTNWYLHFYSSWLGNKWSYFDWSCLWTSKPRWGASLWTGSETPLYPGTHIHADHITGAWWFYKGTESKIALSGNIGSNGLHRTLAHGDKSDFGHRFLTVRETPSHTAGCLTFVLDNEKMAFTGDCLLIRGCGRTDFQGGNAAEM